MTDQPITNEQLSELAENEGSPLVRAMARELIRVRPMVVMWKHCEKYGFPQLVFTGHFSDLQLWMANDCNRKSHSAPTPAEAMRAAMKEKP